MCVVAHAQTSLQLTRLNLAHLCPQAISSFFVSRVRSCLHLVLCFSPVGDAFRQRLRMFPSLVGGRSFTDSAALLLRWLMAAMTLDPCELQLLQQSSRSVRRSKALKNHAWFTVSAAHPHKLLLTPPTPTLLDPHHNPNDSTTMTPCTPAGQLLHHRLVQRVAPGGAGLCGPQLPGRGGAQRWAEGRGQPAAGGRGQLLRADAPVGGEEVKEVPGGAAQVGRGGGGMAGIQD